MRGHTLDLSKCARPSGALVAACCAEGPNHVGVGLDLMTPGSAPSLGGGETIDPRLHPDVDEPLGHVAVAGLGGGMPAAYPSKQVVTFYADRATIMPGIRELTLPLASMRVTNARPAILRWSRRKAADATWSVQAEGTNMALTFRGRWSLFAQLGRLGGWSEPT